MSKLHYYSGKIYTPFIIPLTDKNFESIGVTYETATEEDIRLLLSHRLHICADFDDFTFEEEKEDN